MWIAPHAQGFLWLSSGRCDLQYSLLQSMVFLCPILLLSLFPFVEDWLIASSLCEGMNGQSFPISHLSSLKYLQCEGCQYHTIDPDYTFMFCS